MRPALFFALLLALLTIKTARAEPVQAPHIAVDIKADVSTFIPGQPFWVAVNFVPEPHWHTYWQNPGDSGLAPTLDWQLPPGWQAGAIQWQVPKAIDIGGIVNFGFEGPSNLLVQLTPPKDAQSLAVKVKASWLVCQQACIPGDAMLSLALSAGKAAQKDNSGFFDEARQKLPALLPGRGRMELQQNVVSYALQVPELIGTLPKVFVANPELVENGAKPQLLWQGDTLLLSLPKNPYFTEPPTDPKVLLVTPDKSVLVTMAQPKAPAAGHKALWLLCLMALAGGLVLNIMPCVFPVLAIKALHLKAGQGLQYLAGVLVSFWVLALTLFALRQAGEAVGWGFHLQSPVFVALLASLFAFMGLSLLTRLELGTRLMSLGQDRIEHGHPLEAFLTGVLAVVVASPCTAPLMAPAIGIGLTLPLWKLLLVFSALGLGLALPMVLLENLPALRRALPKPGLWMAAVKKILAFPLLLTAVWLLWVMNNLSGQGFWLLAAWVLGVGIWLLPHRLFKVLAWLPLLLVALLPLWQSADKPPSIAFDETTLKERLAQHRPVLVNMTADWCITCKVNESTTLAREETRALFTLYDVTYLEGDWTARDPVITRYLESFGRAGVPLYVLYDQQGKPHVLPQLLTPGLLANALKDALENTP
ncbi:protein-disulfide reductase DsbD family protein [Gallaecimonas pentaromativorans]|uniref:protein-disulfide reductase DsbD family protein n=1 Tax=Gallaecimonas pentaromativorans TaxID=584787 RepID=UPI003A8EA1E4